MESVLECLPPGSRAAILRLRSLGDCVLTTPALDVLKRARPDLRLAVVVEPRFRAIFEGNPDVEEILEPEPRGLRAWGPRLSVNFHGGSRSAWLTARSGARYRAGFGHYRFQFLYNVRIPRAQEILGVERPVHTAEHLASAMFYLGAPRMEIPRAKLAADGMQRGEGRPAAVIHPFASAPDKTWTTEGFLEVAEYLRGCGLDPVVVGGAADDFGRFGGLRKVSGSLEEVKRLLAGASLFVGNDSGPAHMAAAFGLPVVVIFGASDRLAWGPWRTASEVVTAAGGITEVRPAQVIEALTRLRVHA